MVTSCRLAIHVDSTSFARDSIIVGGHCLPVSSVRRSIGMEHVDESFWIESKVDAEFLDMGAAKFALLRNKF